MRSLAVPIKDTKDVNMDLSKTTVQTRAPVTHIASCGSCCVICAGTSIFDVNLENYELQSKMSRGKSLMNYSDIRKDCELVVTAEESGSIMCNIISQHSMLKRFYGLKSQATVAKFTPDGYSVIGCSKQGTLVVWDLPTATTQMALKVSQEQLTDLCFLKGEAVVVSTLNGWLFIINYRNNTIQQGISEAPPRQTAGNYLLQKFNLECKITSLLHSAEQQDTLYCVSDDYIFALDISNYQNAIKIKHKSQQILKGVSNVQIINNVVYTGCLDGTIRRFNEELQDMEIVFNLQKAITSFHALQGPIFLAGTSENLLYLVSKQQPVRQLTQKEQFKKQLQQPRPGIDTVLNVYKKAVIAPAAATLLFKNNYAKAIEYAIADSFEQTVAVLRELEYLGGKALDFGLAALSDDGRQLFYKYIVQGLETEYVGLLLRSLKVSIWLIKDNMSDGVRLATQQLQQQLQEWFAVVENAYKAFV